MKDKSVSKTRPAIWMRPENKSEEMQKKKKKKKYKSDKKTVTNFDLATDF